MGTHSAGTPNRSRNPPVIDGGMPKQHRAEPLVDHRE
jgi:hypothetical protein